VIGREWYAKTAPKLAENTKAKLLRFLEVDVFPWIGVVCLIVDQGQASSEYFAVDRGKTPIP
jgi:hypothetical protein